VRKIWKPLSSRKEPPLEEEEESEEEESQGTGKTSVLTLPPTEPDASSTRTDCPRRWAARAAARPEAPAPTTTRSASGAEEGEGDEEEEEVEEEDDDAAAAAAAVAASGLVVDRRPSELVDALRFLVLVPVSDLVEAQRRL